MNIVKQDVLEVFLANADKPISLSNFTYPLNSLDDRVFEILTYTIFKKRIAIREKAVQEYEDVQLMQGVGEKGMDCILTRNQKISAVIQCKKSSKNLSKNIILEEVAKFAIHVLLDPKRFSSSKEFKYFMATSTGYTGDALKLLEEINDKNFFKSFNLEPLIIKIIKKYKEFDKLNLKQLLSQLPAIIQGFTFEYIRPSDYNSWINSFPEIIDTFFEIKKVTDNSLIEKSKNEILSKIETVISPNDSEAIDLFIKSYKTAAVEKLNTINFIGFDLHKYRQRPTDITLTELFVQPSLKQRVEETNKKVESVVNRDLKIANIFKSDKHLIILGDPGAGKSLLVKFVIVQLLKNDAGSIGLRQYSNFIPFRIELRKYNEVRENRSIVEYLTEILTKEYQTTIKVEHLAKLLETNQSLIFFDGLDEIFNVSHKSKVKENIEAFSSMFPQSKSVVTSRFIGYHDIKFNSKKFDEFAIQNFKTDQINELVRKFYTTQIGNSEKRNKAISTCLSQIEKDVDDDLKSNPLIMTLILILSSNNIVIPDSKLEIYEACTKTLVDSIDTKEKELTFEMPIKHKRLAFAHLAYWQYESLTKNKPVNYDNAVKSISSFLIERGEETEFTEAEEKAKKFLEYAEKRSIYFEDNFTHKTFLEYYTADYLYINYFTKASDSARKKVISIITTYLPKSFWYIVFELLLTRVDNEQADEELLDEIFKNQLASDSLNVFYFLVSNMGKIKNVSDEVKKSILKKTIMLCIKGEKVTEIRRGFNFQENSLLSKINVLVQDKLSFKLLQESVIEIENQKMSQKDFIEFYILYYELCSLRRGKEDEHPLKITNISKVNELALKDVYLFSQSMIPVRDRNKILPIEILLEQMKYFGKKSLFEEMKFRHRENTTRIDVFNIYFMSAIETGDFKSFKEGYQILLDNNVTQKEILQHEKSTSLYFYFRSENLKKLIDFYLKSDDDKIDQVILNLFSTRPFDKEAYEELRSSYKNPKLKAFDQILNRK